MGILWLLLVGGALAVGGYSAGKTAAEERGRAAGWGAATAAAELIGAGWAFLVGGAIYVEYPDLYEPDGAALVLLLAGGALGALLPISLVRALPPKDIAQTDSAAADVSVPTPQIVTTPNRRWIDPREWPATLTLVLVAAIAVAAVAYPLAALPSLGAGISNLGPGPRVPDWLSGPDPMDLWSTSDGLQAPDHPFAGPAHFVLTVMASNGTPTMVECVSEALTTGEATLAWVEHIAEEGLSEEQASALAADAFMNPAGQGEARNWVSELIHLSSVGDGCLSPGVFSDTFRRALDVGRATTFAHLIIDDLVLDEPLWGGIVMLSGATLDCDGELVTRFGHGTGILIVGAHDVTVTGCVVQNVDDGVLIRDSSDVQLSDITVRGASDGIFIENSSAVLEDSAVFDARRGVFVTLGTGPVEIRRTEVTASLYGIRVGPTAGVVLDSNEVRSLRGAGGGDGIVVNQGAADVTVEANDIWFSSRGIVVQSAGSGIVLNGNSLTDAARGIVLLDSEGVTAEGNSCSGVAEPSVPQGLC